MGMSYTEYWDMDSTLVVAYRKAEEIKNDRINEQLWLQGMYFYDALGAISPILRAFAKKGTKPGKYPEKPYDITEKARKKEHKTKDRRVYDKGLDRMKAFMNATNKRLGKVENQEPKEVTESAADRN